MKSLTRFAKSNEKRNSQIEIQNVNPMVNFHLFLMTAHALIQRYVFQKLEKLCSPLLPSKMSFFHLAQYDALEIKDYSILTITDRTYLASSDEEGSDHEQEENDELPRDLLKLSQLKKDEKREEMRMTMIQLLKKTKKSSQLHRRYSDYHIERFDGYLNVQ
jgi:hypothetical protein